MSAFLHRYGAQIGELTLEHLWLTGWAIAIATLISVPLGITLTRNKRLAKPVLAVVNTLQTIPSLAMLGFLLPLPLLGGRAARIAITALVAYALLPIVRNTYAGIRGVDPTIIEVAKALGMTSMQRLNARGVAPCRRRDPRRIAYSNSYVCWHRHDRRSSRRRRPWRPDLPRRRIARQSARPGRRYPRGTAGSRRRRPARPARIQNAHPRPEDGVRSLLAAAAAVLLTALTACSMPRPDHPVIGAKNFTEQVVLGELLAQEIEAKTGMKVERRFYLAGSYICHQALISGRIDGYPEYTGTALTAILKQPVDKDPSSSLATVTRLYKQRYNVEVGPTFGFNNTFAMVIREKTLTASTSRR